MIPELQQLGFTRNEANVYLSALKLGRSSVQQLAQASGLNRITVHSIVEKFEQLQIFYRSFEGKRRRINVIDPSRLRFLLKREEAGLLNKQRALQMVFPALNDLFFKTQRGLEVLTFQGEEGYRTICEDVLNCEGEILEYANIDHLLAVIGRYIHSEFLPKKRRLQRQAKFLFVDTPRARQYIQEEYMRPGAAPMAVKFIDEKIFAIDINLVIYGEKVTFLTPSNMSAIVIKDRAVSNALRPFFTFVWDRAGEEIANRCV